MILRQDINHISSYCNYNATLMSDVVDGFPLWYLFVSLTTLCEERKGENDNMMKSIEAFDICRQKRRKTVSYRESHQ